MNLPQTPRMRHGFPGSHDPGPRRWSSPTILQNRPFHLHLEMQTRPPWTAGSGGRPASWMSVRNAARCPSRIGMRHFPCCLEVGCRNRAAAKLCADSTTRFDRGLGIVGVLTYFCFSKSSSCLLAWQIDRSTLRSQVDLDVGHVGVLNTGSLAPRDPGSLAT